MTTGARLTRLAAELAPPDPARPPHMLAIEGIVNGLLTSRGRGHLDNDGLPFAPPRCVPTLSPDYRTPYPGL